MRMSIFAMVVAVCMGCASKHTDESITPMTSCVNDPKFAQVKIKIEHDNTGKPTKIWEVSEAKVYEKPQNANQMEQVCWVIEPVDPTGPKDKLYESVSIISKLGTPAFHMWTSKTKMPGGTLYLASGLPLPVDKDEKWEYTVKCGLIDLDPVIIIIDESH